ncbi:MAG TPA: phosphoenolpyruvate carboxylase [Parafilimonas sp.]|nr:phosphoenolpyruvate carboxylase [Parafilimonas sp.]
MSTSSTASMQEFKNRVALKFQLYNSLFTALPFHRIEKTGVLLSLFLLDCEEGYNKNYSPLEIINKFLEQNTTYEEAERIDLLFRFVQYAERQVTLFDALEDAAFAQVNDLSGAGTVKQLCAQISQMQKEDSFIKKLNDFSVRIVLTAHPTQFYPGEVLGIINDLSHALENEDTEVVNIYLQQLGKTPFLKKKKPTPYDEAVSLLWFLENVFYDAAGNIMSTFKNEFKESAQIKHHLIRMGFWPGDDRDGNPFVTTDITLKVAETLRAGILRSYYKDTRWLKRRLTFKGVDELIALLETRLYNNLYANNTEPISQNEIIGILKKIIALLEADHNSLFINSVYTLLYKVEVFGLYFASLDIRQDSSIHAKLFAQLVQLKILPADYSAFNEDKKIDALLHLTKSEINFQDNDLFTDTLKSVEAIKIIQQRNGVEGCSRYVISHCNSALHVIEVYALFLLTGWKKQELTADIVPLFETVDDLRDAASVMKKLYNNKIYRQHIKQRSNTQTIMLGFSDGTKDGGYLMANWSIYKAKEELTSVSKSYGINVIFFDGRGGPPARGGGKTHKFYASMGHDISNKEIQLTVQGQTVSSNFGTINAAQFNIEQLIHAGIANDLFSSKENTLGRSEERLLKQLSEDSYISYSQLKNHPAFVDYLAEISPLRYYAETNIGSRPTKRGKSSGLTLNDLRAIPFVGSFSQLKQNITGYYGVGTALKKAADAGRFKYVEQLYKNSLFFRTLIDNCEMAMMKCFFPLTAYLADHPRYGKLWHMMYNEFQLTEAMLKKLTGNEFLMEDYPVEHSSIQMRERIVLPLVTIQQYALIKVREAKEQMPFKEKYEKLAMRCSFGIINAGRNSA